MTQRFRIAIDMDEVLADTAAHQVAWYVREFGPGLTTAQLHGRHLLSVIPAGHHEAVRGHLSHPRFFRDIPVMAGAIDAVVALQARYDVFVASAAMEHPVSFGPKFEWLREHFPMIPPSHCVFCGDKSVLGAEMLIDDSPYQLVKFRGEPVIFSAPHNALETRFRRFRDWPHAVAELLASQGPGATPHR